MMRYSEENLCIELGMGGGTVLAGQGINKVEEWVEKVGLWESSL